MIESWSQQFWNALRRNAHTIDGGHMRQSRRMIGQFSFDREGHGYSGVHWVVEVGLPVERARFNTIMGRIRSLQYGEIQSYPIHLYALDPTHDALFEVAHPVIWRNDGDTQEAIDIATDITKRFDAVRKHFGRRMRIDPERTDLLLVVAQQRPLGDYPEMLRAAVMKQPRGTLWLFPDGDELRFATERDRAAAEAATQSPEQPGAPAVAGQEETP